MKFENVEVFRSDVLISMNQINDRIAEIRNLTDKKFTATYANELQRILEAVSHLINQMEDVSVQSLNKREAHQLMYETGVYLGQIVTIAETLRDSLEETTRLYQELNLIAQESDRLFALRGDILFQLVQLNESEI